MKDRSGSRCRAVSTISTSNEDSLDIPSEKGILKFRSATLSPPRGVRKGRSKSRGKTVHIIV